MPPSLSVDRLRSRHLSQRSRWAWLIALAAWAPLGCEAEPGAKPEIKGQGGGPISGELSIRFMVSERPQDAEPEWVELDEARWVDPLRVVVEGLAPGELIRLETSLGSWAQLEADEAGVVDLARSAPSDGTWLVADADGLFWSAPPADQPLFEIEVRVHSLDEPGRADTRVFRRAPLDERVLRTPLNDGTTVGALIRPASIPPGEKRPAVLAFGGSEGGTFSGELAAYYLAQLGYVAMGVGYFAAPGLPADLDRVPLEILEADLALLASQPDVDPKRIAVLGGSRGGELALLLGAKFPAQVHAVVAQVPSGYVWGALSGANASAWSHQGADVPFVPAGLTWPDSYTVDGAKHYVLTPMFERSVESASPEALLAATIEVEHTAGPILFLGAEEDALWPSCAFSDVSWERLSLHGHQAEHGDENHCFEGAGHAAVGFVGLSTLESEAFYSPENGGWMDLGGTPEANGRAQRQANTITRRFLERALGFEERAW